MPHKLSVLYSQLGYYPDGEKHAFVRAPEDMPADTISDMPFRLIAETGDATLEKLPAYWGALWRSQWWVLDFSEVTRPGRYRLEISGEETAAFDIQPHVLAGRSLRLTALDQLEDRKKAGVGGWRDCGSETRELSSMVITVLGLCDVWSNGNLLTGEREKLLREIIRGADAICTSQENWPDDPEKDGRFNHDAFRQTNYGTTDYHNWHDTAFAMLGLLSAEKAVRLSAPALAAEYLSCAEKAYRNAVARPYPLESDFRGRDHITIEYTDDFADDNHRLARRFYDVQDDAWELPRSLRTKEKLTFAHACAILYKRTGCPEYLDTAAAYADAACERQCLDPDSPGYGHFYAFENDNRHFSLSFGHGHKYHMGTIEPCDLGGLIELMRLLPSGERTARYMRAMRLYADGFVKRAAKLTPLSLFPQTVYGAERGGISFFKMAVHGFTCLYGQIAHDLFALAALLQDEQLARIAERNLLFPVGRNPGMAESYRPRSWACISLIKGVGSRSFGGVHTLSVIPDGSVMNGFAPAQFDIETPFADTPDEPLGFYKPDGTLWFNEDYLPHSHGYVRGVALREQPFCIHVRFADASSRHHAEIAWDDGEKQTFRAAANGKIAITETAMYRRGLLRCVEMPWVEEIAFITLPAGTLQILFHEGSGLRFSAALQADGDLVIRVQNPAPYPVCASFRLDGAGIQLAQTSFGAQLSPGGNAAFHSPVQILDSGAWLITLTRAAESTLPETLLTHQKILK